MSPRVAASIAFLALLPAPAAGQAVTSPSETADEKARADAFLRSKGLTPIGTVYVAEQEQKFEAMRGPLDALARSLGDFQGELARLEANGQTIRAAVADAQRRLQDLEVLVNNAAIAAALNGPGGKPGGGNQGQASNPLQELLLQRSITQNQLVQARDAWFGASSEYDRVGRLAAAKGEEGRRQKAAADGLAAEAGALYRRLMDDPEVRQALVILGRGTGKRYTLGPLSRFHQNVKELAAMQLASKGFQVNKKGGGVVLGADADVKAVEEQARRFQVELRDELARAHDAEHRDALRDKQIGDDRAKEARLVADLAAAPAARAPLLEAQVRAIREKTRRLVEEDAAAGAEQRELSRRVAARRELFVESLDVLARAEEARREKQDEIEHDPDVKDQLRALGQRKATLLKPSTTKPEKTFLDRANEDLVRDVVPLVPDRTGLWVAATVNDVPLRRMVVNPAVETVRLSARTAAAAGVEPDDRPPLRVTTADGKTYEARRATLRSVRVGTRTTPADGVECLVFPEGYDAPPILGASFFERYVARVDPDAARLSLIEVKLAPASAHAPTRPAPKDRPAAPPRAGGF